MFEKIKNPTLVFLLLMTVFRFVITSVLFVPDRLWIVLLIVFVITLALSNMRKFQKYDYLVMGFCFIPWLYSIAIVWYNNFSINSILYINQSISSTALMAFFPVVINRLYSNSDLKENFTFIAKVITPSAGIIFIVNYFFRHFSYEYYNSEDVVINVFKAPAEIVNIRNIGIMINLENSALLLTASTVFCVWLLICVPFQRKEPITKMHWSICILGIAGIFATTSLSNAFIFLLLSSLLILKSLPKKELLSKLFNYKNLILTMLVLFFSRTLFKGFIERSFYYLENPDTFLGRYVFIAGERWSDLIINTKALSLQPTGFDVIEIHCLLGIKQFGILPVVGWYICLFSPLFFSFLYKKFSSIGKSTLLFCLVMTLATFHYSGSEAWGNNFIFYMALVILFKDVFQSQAEGEIYAKN